MKKLKGKWLFDTNILIYSLDETSPHHLVVIKLFDRIEEGRIYPVVSTQNITETVKVLYRAYKQPLTKIEARVSQILESYQFEIISPLPTTTRVFFDLLLKQKDKISIYDTFLAATMMENKITKMFSANNKDFVSFQELTVVDPGCG